MRKPVALVLILGVLAAGWVGIAAGPAPAQERRLQFIRDAEIEHIIRSYAAPIFEVAGLDGEAVTIALVNDRTLNAFVAGGMNLFVHTGLLLATETPDQLIGVIAHETGHIAGGHLVRTRDAIEGASAQAILSALLGIGTIIATGRGDAAVAVMSGGQEIARRSLLSYSRAQESAADQAALTYLDKAGMSAEGLLRFLERLADQELLPASQQDPFIRTHPLTQDRISAVRHHVETSPHTGKPLPAAFHEMHRRMQAKLLGFLHPQTALRRFWADDTSVAARYGRAIALYRQSDLAGALPLIDALIAEEPDNPFFHELKGQMLFEHGRIGEALEPYRRAVELMPDSALLRAELAHALIETNDPARLDEALEHLQVSTRLDRRSPFAWRLMATAWGRKGNEGMAAYALAEEALARGDKELARAQAEKAEALLPAGSPGWLRAQDIRTVVGGS